MPDLIRIAVDAMGGDRAPEVVVEGTLRALADHDDVHVVLVGRPEALALAGGRAGADRLSLVPADDVIAMDEHPGLALRKKPRSSVAVCAKLMQERAAAGFVSAGNTGAVVASALFAARLLPGVHRPGIAVPLPSLRGTTVLCDVGANIHCKPAHYLCYAVMASAFCQHVLGVAVPRVGLLNIGSEETKGTETLQSIRALLEQAGRDGHISFVGSVEGNDIFEGTADVVVCDGLMGNVVLKTAEGAGRLVFEHVRRVLHEASRGNGTGAWLAQGLERLRKLTDFAEQGGAPLLGVDGCTIIAHGRSEPPAIASAIRVARDFALQGVNQHITERLAALGKLVGAP